MTGILTLLLSWTVLSVDLTVSTVAVLAQTSELVPLHFSLVCLLHL